MGEAAVEAVAGGHGVDGVHRESRDETVRLTLAPVDAGGAELHHGFGESTVNHGGGGAGGARLVGRADADQGFRLRLVGCHQVDALPHGVSQSLARRWGRVQDHEPATLTHHGGRGHGRRKRDFQLQEQDARLAQEWRDAVQVARVDRHVCAADDRDAVFRLRIHTDHRDACRVRRVCLKVRGGDAEVGQALPRECAEGINAGAPASSTALPSRATATA